MCTIVIAAEFAWMQVSTVNGNFKTAGGNFVLLKLI